MTATFLHQACVYDSDEEFLAMAVPFVSDGLAEDEPVMVVTTPHNIALVRDVIGDPQGVDYIDHETWYRAPGRTTLNYYDRVRGHTGPGRAARVIGEVFWLGRAENDLADWKRYESTLNVTFADTSSWIVCPYDTRVLPDHVVADALCTHPGQLSGRQIRPCAGYVSPESFVTREGAIMTPAPPDARILPMSRDPGSVRRFTATWAGAHGLPTDQITLLSAAAGEVAAYLADAGDGRIGARLWQHPRGTICEVHAPTAQVTDPFVGYQPPGLDPRPGDELWLARYLCELEVHREGPSCAIRLQLSPA